MIERRKKRNAYQIRRSAVKNTHNANRGIERIRQAKPKIAEILGFRENKTTMNTVKKIKS